VPDRPCPFEKTPTFQSAAEHRFGDSLLASAFGPLTVNPIERARGKSSSSMFEDFELSAKRFLNPSEEVWKLFHAGAYAVAVAVAVEKSICASPAGIAPAATGGSSFRSGWPSEAASAIPLASLSALQRCSLGRYCLTALNHAAIDRPLPTPSARRSKLRRCLR
jgi:hypothetical protein